MKSAGAFLVIVGSLAVASCGQGTVAPVEEVASEAEPVDINVARDAALKDAVAADPAFLPPVDAAAIQTALSNPARPNIDLRDDRSRKPAAVLTFAGVAPGMSIYEMEAGAGYYTELVSRIVGPDGSVTMQNPPAFESFLADAVADRLKNNRLPNVVYDRVNFDELSAEDASVDLVTWILGPHELYFTPSEGVILGEVGPSYAEAFRVLKPGGKFLALDHAATPGSDETTGHTLHRIDPEIVKKAALAAGFVLEAESDILRNPADKHDMGVFDPKIRRNTDRFIFRFVKPL